MTLWDIIRENDLLQTALFLQKVEDLNATDHGRTLLMTAIQASNSLAIDTLIERGADVNAWASQGSALSEAVNRNDSVLVTRLLNLGADPDSDDLPLGKAVTEGYVNIVKILLEAGADPNFVGDGIECPMQLAGYERVDDVVELLVKHGGDLSMIEGVEWDQHQTRMFNYHVGPVY